MLIKTSQYNLKIDLILAFRSEPGHIKFTVCTVQVRRHHNLFPAQITLCLARGHTIVRIIHDNRRHDGFARRRRRLGPILRARLKTDGLFQRLFRRQGVLIDGIFRRVRVRLVRLRNSLIVTVIVNIIIVVVRRDL